jgi:hypothetical protein
VNNTEAEGQTLALIADLLRSIADILASAPPPQDGGQDAGRVDAAAEARRALQAVRDGVRDILTRATAVTLGSDHPKVVQALAALRAALVEASEAVELLQETVPDTNTHEAEPQ